MLDPPSSLARADLRWDTARKFIAIGQVVKREGEAFRSRPFSICSIVIQYHCNINDLADIKLAHHNFKWYNTLWLVSKPKTNTNS
jgi:hypothetical protein